MLAQSKGNIERVAENIVIRPVAEIRTDNYEYFFLNLTCLNIYICITEIFLVDFSSCLTQDKFIRVSFISQNLSYRISKRECEPPRRMKISPRG